jgi:hypothetical protein
MLVALAGKARVGKDTIGRYLVREYGFAHYYFAKPLKQMLEAGLDLPEAAFQSSHDKERVLADYGTSYRALAQTIGTEWGRHIVATLTGDENLWVKVAARRWSQVQDAMTAETFAPNGMVITDCRFDNEAMWVRAAGGIVVHVLGKNQLEGMTEQTKNHKSEQGVTFVQSFDNEKGKYDGDRLVFNDYDAPSEASLRTLHASIDALMNGLRYAR